MSLWVQVKSYEPTQVTVDQCIYADDFTEACKWKLRHYFGSHDEIYLLSSDGDPLDYNERILTENTAETPLLITVIPVMTKIELDYGQAPMEFISLATGINDHQESWKDSDIPIDTSIVPSDEFIGLFKKNFVIEFYAKSSRQTIIDMFLREIVSQFPHFIIHCEHFMKFTNESNQKRLKGVCDYTLCHRGIGLRNNPLLVIIKACGLNRETMLKCIGICASIHYTRKRNREKNTSVYGIHSTGSSWKFIYIDQNGSCLVSNDYYLKPEKYEKEGFDLVYRLVYYVVNQSHLNNPLESLP